MDSHVCRNEWSRFCDQRVVCLDYVTAKENLWKRFVYFFRKKLNIMIITMESANRSSVFVFGRLISKGNSKKNHWRVLTRNLQFLKGLWYFSNEIGTIRTVHEQVGIYLVHCTRYSFSLRISQYLLSICWFSISSRYTLTFQPIE